MKTLAATWIVGILVFSGLGVDALSVHASTSLPSPIAHTGGRAHYTHTVLVEVGTATWCPNCPDSNAAWHTIDDTHNYNFQYTELVYDQNTEAQQHLANDYHIYAVPTSYFDGGQNTYPGTSIPTFENYLDISGERTVPDLYATLTVTWLGNAQLDISLTIKNNESTDYGGTLRVYVLEKVSTLWKDYSGYWYNHAFLGFPIKKAIIIPADDLYTDQTTWTSPYPDISQNNIQIILAVFNDEAHQGYSNPPSGAPFNAYYVDETVATEPGSGGAPLKPGVPTGPTSGYANIMYNYTGGTTDPHGNPLYYRFDWGDGTDSGWIGPYPSGAPVTANHTWTYGGTFHVKLKAKEMLESPWSDPLAVTIIGSTLKLVQLKGGFFFVTSMLANTGNEALSKIQWRISLFSGAWIGKNTTGVISSLAGHASASLKSKVILGFGETHIKIEAWIPGGPSTMMIDTGKIFLFFIRITGN